MWISATRTFGGSSYPSASIEQARIFLYFTLAIDLACEEVVNSC
jgi:hypothetical protein